MNTAMKLIEVGLIGVGVAAFCWWQFRDLKIEREKTAARAAQQSLEAANSAADSPAGAGPQGDTDGVAQQGDQPSQETGRTT
jgi:hypothetical protein